MIGWFPWWIPDQIDDHPSKTKILPRVTTVIRLVISNTFDLSPKTLWSHVGLISALIPRISNFVELALWSRAKICHVGVYTYAGLCTRIPGSSTCPRVKWRWTCSWQREVRLKIHQICTAAAARLTRNSRSLDKAGYEDAARSVAFAILQYTVHRSDRWPIRLRASSKM